MNNEAKDPRSETGKEEVPFSNTVIEELGHFLTLHFQRLENFFNLMDRSQADRNCHMCEFSGIGRFFLENFREEMEKVCHAMNREFGTIHIARVNIKNDILGVIAVPEESRANHPEGSQR